MAEELIESRRTIPDKPLKKHWRFSKEVAEELVSLVGQGAPIRTAAEIMEISARTLEEWLTIGKAESEEWETLGPTQRTLGGYGSLYLAIQKARAYKRHQDFKFIERAYQGGVNPQTGQWEKGNALLGKIYLEALSRVDPDYWGRRMSVKTETEMRIIRETVTGSEWMTAPSRAIEETSVFDTTFTEEKAESG